MRRRTLVRLTTLSSGLVLICCAAAWAASAVWNVARAESNSAQHISSFRWHEAPDWFGGFSGIELTGDGTGFVAITDRSHIVEGQISRDGDRIAGVSITRHDRLLDADGAPIRPEVEDSEGLTIVGRDTYFVSFETPHRVLAYSPTGVHELPTPKSFRKFRYNGSFESLASDATGQLLLISEKPPRKPDVPRVWRWTESKGWRGAGPYPELDGFLPVGADFGPDGAVYVLERKFVSVGFRSRLRRFTLTPTGLEGGAILLNTPLARHDNLEGVSIWQDSAGGLRATMISDDNFLWLQRTEIVEYRLPDLPG